MLATTIGKPLTMKIINRTTLVAGSPSLQLAQRGLSSYVLERLNYGRGGGSPGGGDAIWHWPIAKTNTVFNIVPQGHQYVVERFGKLHKVENPGWFLAIPFVDNIAYVIDMRERALDIQPQAAITRDNVSVEVSGNLFVKFLDAERAAYGAFNPLYSVSQVRTITTVRWGDC